MGDKYTSFYSLKENYRNDIDYRIKKIDIGGKILILAPHGGGIERGTSELARAIAGNDLSLYLFEGLMPKACESQELHIPSTRFDEPKCLKLVQKFQTTLAIHGCGGKEPMIYVGGKDIDFKERLIAELAAKGYPVQLGTEKYAGIYSSNICNRTNSRKGVQLEFSNGLRRFLFDNWRTRKGRKTTTELFSRLTSDIRAAIG